MTTNIATARPLNASRIAAALTHCFAAKRPVFLWGAPGIGKSDVVASVAEKLGGLLVDIRLNLLEPTDLRGIPFYNKDSGKMEWAPPIDLPSAELCAQYPVVVLFLDEMNSAPPSVQAAAYQLTLNRKIGTYKLPDNVVIVAAGNRDSDKGVTYTMPSPLSNRFIHLEMAADVDVWIEWAVKHNIHPDVVGYISFAKDKLFTFDPKAKQRSFATPRTWAFTSEIVRTQEAGNFMSEKEMVDLVAGAIGSGVATEFMTHREMASKLPNPSDILSGKVTKLDDKSKEISVMYTLTISMCYELGDFVKKNAIEGKLAKADDKKLHEMTDHFFKFMMDNFKTEMCVMGAKTALATYDLPIDVSSLKNFDEFFKRFNKQITDAINMK